MPAPFTIKVCCGTTCFVLGGSDLLTLEDHLPETWRDQITLKGSPCLECCNDPTNGKPPFVVINDTVISEANLAKVLDYLHQNR